MTEEELTTDEKETIKAALWHYHQNKYHRITDYDKVIQNRQQITENIYYYPCPLQDIYLDNNAYAVSYGRQSVWTIYYNENNEIISDSATNPTPPNEYHHSTTTVYYDPRETITEIPQNYEGDVNYPLIELGDIEWQRDSSGGGGVIG